MSRLRIDGDLCAGHGRCYAHAPELIDYDDAGFAQPRDNDIDVSAEDEDAAQEAAASCPERAITYTS